MVLNQGVDISPVEIFIQEKIIPYRRVKYFIQLGKFANGGVLLTPYMH